MKVSTFVSQAAFETFYNLSATSDQVQELATIKGESLFMNVTGMYNEVPKFLPLAYMTCL